MSSIKPDFNFYRNPSVSLANGLPSCPTSVHDFVNEAMRAHYARVAVALDGVLESGAELSELALSHQSDWGADPLGTTYVTTIWLGNVPVARIRLALK